MRGALRLTLVTALTAAGVGALGVAPASADCVNYEDRERTLIVTGTTKVYYPPFVTDVNPGDCLRGEQSIPTLVEF